ncbi:phage tail fiber protein [Gorillibacterium sp. sgz500922]|uniref:phage tail fiber protein n=1 Tax=Gorillibacterium sp. sgz500922 TaxID=3446694 RepID=UPI003F67090B
MQISNYLSAALLNAAVRNTAWTPPAAVYLALYTSDPTAADTGTEVSGGAYARQTVAFVAPSVISGKQTVSNSGVVSFPVATADWGLVTHVGLRSAATGGNLLWSMALTNPRTIQTGDTPKFLAGSVIVRFAQ